MEIKKKIRLEIKELIEEGYNKQFIFDELRKKHKRPIDLAKWIREFPTIENKKKYASKNTLLIVLLSITLLFDLLALSFGSIIWDIALIYLVGTYQATHYQWISFRAGFSVIVIIIMLFFTDFNMINIIAVLIGLLILIPTFILANKLEKQLTPFYVQKKIKHIDENGKVSYKLKFEFKD
jgi:hypothetical protein